MACDGVAFSITDDQSLAHPFTEAYADTICGSLWGGQEWEKEAYKAK